MEGTIPRISQKPAVDYFSLTSQRPQSATPCHQDVGIDYTRLLGIPACAKLNVVAQLAGKFPPLIEVATQPQSPDITMSDRSQNISSPATQFIWDQSPQSGVALPSPESCDSIIPSPTSPTARTYPNSYTLPNQEVEPDIKYNQTFDFGSSDDWIGRDDRFDKALSPSSDFFPELKIEPMSPNMQQLEIQGGSASSCTTSTIPNGVDDTSVVFGDDPMTEEQLFQTPPPCLISPPITDPHRDRFFFTPPSWPPPSARNTTRNSSSYAVAAILSPERQSKLIAQAMPSQSRVFPTSPSSISSPEPRKRNRRKRKSTNSFPEDGPEESAQPSASNGNRYHPTVKKTAHNMIEKRYRTNLNDKIAALRDSVPSLRVVTKKNDRGEEVSEDLQGLTAAHKLNKATVLSKATEYISHLEKRNRTLTKENQAQKSRIEAFEILMMAKEAEEQQQLEN